MSIKTPITTLISEDSLPKEFSFIETPVSQLLSNVYFTEYHVGYSSDNANVSNSLLLETSSAFGFTIPGIGLKLVLNSNQSGSTSFWFNLSTYKGILKYLEGFKLSSFGETLAQLDEILQSIFRGNNATILYAAVNEYETGTNKIETGFNNLSTLCSLVISYDTTKSEIDNFKELSDVIFNNSNISAWDAVIHQYVDTPGTSASQKKDKRAYIFGKYLSANNNFSNKELNQYLYHEMVPRFQLSTELSLGLEIPRKFLIPVNPDGTLESDETKLLTLELAKSVVNYSTAEGFSMGTDVAASFPAQYPKAQIGKTGFYIGFTEARMHFQGQHKGLSAKEVILEFPKSFQADGPKTDNGLLKATNLFIGTGGISGIISLEAINPNDPNPPLLYKKLGNWEVSLNACSLTFQQSSILESNIRGQLKIPGFKDSTGADALVDSFNTAFKLGL